MVTWEMEFPPKKQYKKIPATDMDEPVPERFFKEKKLADVPEASDKSLIKACKLWDKITEKMHNREYDMPEELEHNGTDRPYSEGDYRPLQCRITGKLAELTVGSSSGHKAKVNLEKGTLEYFDNDDDPNQVMNDLLEEAGLKCRVRSDPEGVACTGVKKPNVDEVFKVLAMPTSMDFRLNQCKTSKVDPEEVCREEADNSSLEDLGYKEPPSGCDCSQFWDEYVQDCVDNFDYSAYGNGDSEDCKDIEKRFFKEGPKNETLKEEPIEPKVAMRRASKTRGQTKFGKALVLKEQLRPKRFPIEGTKALWQSTAEGFY